MVVIYEKLLQKQDTYQLKQDMSEYLKCEATNGGNLRQITAKAGHLPPLARYVLISQV